MPMLQWNENYFRYEPAYAKDIYAYSILLVSIGQLILILCMYLQKKEFVRLNNSIKLNSKFYKKAFQLNMLIFLIGAFCSYKNLQDIFAAGLENYLSDRIGFGVGSQATLLLSTWLYTSCIIFFYLNLNSPVVAIKKWSFLLFLLSLFFTVVYYTINSNRNSIFILLINLLALYSIFSKKSFQKFNFKQLGVVFKIALISVASIFLFFFIGSFRQQKKIDTNISEGYNITQALNGGFGNHENIVWLLDNQYELEYGSTYLAGILNFVPRSVWTDKPLGAGPRLKNAIYPGSYVIGNTGNSSLTTGFYTEFLMNFGIIGLFLGPVIISFLFVFLLKKLKTTVNPMTNLFLIFTLITFSTEYYYSEFLGFIARFIISGIPLLFLIRITRSKKYYLNNTMMGRYRNKIKFLKVKN